MPSSTEQGWTDGWTEERKKNGRKGRPRFPKRETQTITLVSISRPPQLWRTIFGTFPTLHTATLGSFSPHMEQKPIHCTVCTLIISGDVFLHCSCRKGGEGDDFVPIVTPSLWPLGHAGIQPAALENVSTCVCSRWCESIPHPRLILSSHYQRL